MADRTVVHMPPVSAHDVAAELRRRLPALPVKKLHKLLYYCQGHHLAALGEPLFSESISAYDMGPVVGTLWRAEKDRINLEGRRELDGTQLSTVGYVVSRYGGMSGGDLQRLTHAEAPWQLGDKRRAVGGSHRIELEWIEGYFKTIGVEDDDVPLDPAIVREWLSGARRPGPGEVPLDDPSALRARLTPRA